MKLRDYQQEGVRRLIRFKRYGLAFDKGFGKTITALSAMRCVMHEIAPENILITGPGDALHEAWEPQLRDDERGITLSTYASVKRHLDKPIKLLIIDEAHNINRGTARFDVLRRISRNAEYVWLLSATPTGNTAHRIWSSYALMRPHTYTSYWRWINEYFVTYTDPIAGLQILGVKPRKRDAFTREFRSMFMLVRRNAEYRPQIVINTVETDNQGYSEIPALNEAHLTHVYKLVDSKPKPVIVLYSHLDVGDIIAKKYGVTPIDGRLNVKARAEARLRGLEKGICVASTRVSAEGIDLEAFETMIFAEISSQVALVDQVIGRLTRGPFVNAMEKRVYFVVSKKSRDENLYGLYIKRAKILKPLYNEDVTIIY